MFAKFKRKLWIGASIILGSIIIATIALYYFAGVLATNADGIAKDRSLIDQQAGSLAVLTNLKQQAPQAEIYQAAMKKVLLSENDLINFPQLVNGIASSHQISANATFEGSPLEGSNSSTPGTVTFLIHAQGPLSNLIAFFNDLETNLPGVFVQVANFDLINQGANYQLSGHGTLYFQ